MGDKTMLYHTLDRSRWFVVPAELELPEGEQPVRSFTRVERSVRPEAIAPHEVDVAAARQWIDRRFRESFGRAGEAFGRLVQRVQAAGRAQGRTVRGMGGADLPGVRIEPEDLLGVSPGELYTDPSRAREAVDALFSWASERFRPKDGTETSERPDIGKTLASLGEGLKAAAQRIEAQRKQADADRARQRGEAPARTKLLRVGFFSELRHGDPQGPSLAGCRREQRSPHEDEIVRYLTEAPVLIASPGPVSDVLDPTAGFVGTRSIHTDGVWCWPGDLAHYVRRYHVALPSAFLEHLLSRGWQPGQPDLTAVVF